MLYIMKVYVVLADYDYEGYSEPLFVGSKENAEKFVADRKSKYFTLEIFEMCYDDSQNS